MPYRRAGITVIMLFFFGVIVWTFSYGPARRTFVIPDKTVTVRSASELDSLWHSSGVHGRVTVIFARHLKLLSLGSSFPDGSYLDYAMRRGIVRKAYYVVPDSFWSEIVSVNMMTGALIVPLKVTDTGFLLLHEGGRIHVMPLSKYIPEPDREKALVVIDPALWTKQELARIDGFIRSGQISSDLKVVVGDEKQSQSHQGAISFSAPSGRQS